MTQPILLEIRATDKSTLVITASFTDEDGAAVVPNTITWALRDGNEDVVNERDEVVVATPAASIDIVLSGDDLDYEVDAKRIFTILASYDSDLGSDLPVNAEAVFSIDDLVGA